MSRREIVAVCELAAHLAERYFMLQKAPAYADMDIRASKCAQDAMTLQRLGRSVRNSNKKAHQVSYDHEAVCIRNRSKADEVLRPYGLHSATRHGSLLIIGLPSNGDGEGFAI